MRAIGVGLKYGTYIGVWVKWLSKRQSTIMTVKTESGNNVVRTGKFSCEFTEYYKKMEGLFW
jgi:hypothetical protein